MLGGWIARLLIEAMTTRANLVEVIKRNPAARIAIFTARAIK